MEALVIFGTAFVILLGIFGTMAVVDRYDDGHWWWDKPPTSKWLEARDQAIRIQQLEHETDMLPHSDQEMVHLCKTCERQEALEEKKRQLIEASWRVEPWDGGWRPAGVGQNLYPDQVEITSLGDVEARYIDGMPHIIPDPPPPVVQPGRIKK